MKKIQYLYCTLLLGYLLGVHNGYVALWQGEDPEPAQVFPYAVSALPKADQAALEQGIHAKNQEELTKLLEDYLS